MENMRSRHQTPVLHQVSVAIKHRQIIVIEMKRKPPYEIYPEDWLQLTWQRQSVTVGNITSPPRPDNHPFYIFLGAYLLYKNIFTDSYDNDLFLKDRSSIYMFYLRRNQVLFTTKNWTFYLWFSGKTSSTC